MASKVNSFDDKIKLPVTETISRFYQPQQNRKAIRILTVLVYVFCVSLAAIMLSLYYMYIWDPTVKPFMPKVTNCDKIIIPEQIAIRLTNYTEISADQFYKNILHYYQQSQQRRNMKFRKNFVYNSVGTTTPTTSATVTAAANKLNKSKKSITVINSNLSKLNKNLFKSELLQNTNKTDIIGISSTITTPSIPTTITTESINDYNKDEEMISLSITENSLLNEKNMKLKNIAAVRKQKLSNLLMKSFKLKNNRRLNNDDEDYKDEFDDNNKNVYDGSGHENNYYGDNDDSINLNKFLHIS